MAVRRIEEWLGLSRPAEAEVSGNGKLLAKRQAHNVVTKSFHGLKPDGQGRLVLSFVPHANRAMINAIEVVEE